MSSVARLTPDSPVLVMKTKDSAEPGHGSVVMTHGLTGTVWQRFYSDGSWHSTTGAVAEDWDDLWEHVGRAGLALLLDVPEEG